MANNTVSEYNRAMSAAILAKPSPYRRFPGGDDHHTTSFVGQMNTTVEVGIVGERGDTIGNIAQRSTRSSHVST